MNDWQAVREDTPDCLMVLRWCGNQNKSGSNDFYMGNILTRTRWTPLESRHRTDEGYVVRGEGYPRVVSAWVDDNGLIHNAVWVMGCKLFSNFSVALIELDGCRCATYEKMRISREARGLDIEWT